MDIRLKTFFTCFVVMVLVCAATLCIAIAAGMGFDDAVSLLMVSMAVMMMVTLPVNWVVCFRYEKRRHRVLRTVAERLGFVWSSEDSVFRGKRKGMPFVLSRSGVVVEPGFRWPFLSIHTRLESAEEDKDKIGDVVEFESRDFNRRYIVRAFNKRFAYAVLHARVIQHLLSQTDQFDIEFRRTTLQVACLDDGRAVENEKLIAFYERLIAFVEALLEMIPPYLWADLCDAQDERERG